MKRFRRLWRATAVLFISAPEAFRSLRCACGAAKRGRWAPMNAICLTMSIGALLMNGYGHATETDPCPVQGEAIQWIADYCMFKLETDDEIAVSDCIADEIKTSFSFKSDCAAKAHYKRALCELTIRAEATQEGPIERCVADGSFMGSTVRNGGVGAQQ